MTEVGVGVGWWGGGGKKKKEKNSQRGLKMAVEGSTFLTAMRRYHAS